MEKHEGPDSSNNARPGDDPWLAFSYLVAGVGVYGLIGWALGQWLHAEYLTAIGIVLGAAFGLYLVVARFVRQAPSGPPQAPPKEHSQTEETSHTRPDNSGEESSPELPDIDDRGDTA
ncbi:hypothetical protein SAMN05444157_2728 [Frankineae bacterium MT45]|nr:hypothetical protein SAMN05444157_2728 [Frankineae bacterium MT45]